MILGTQALSMFPIMEGLVLVIYSSALMGLRDASKKGLCFGGFAGRTIDLATLSKLPWLTVHPHTLGAASGLCAQALCSAPCLLPRLTSPQGEGWLPPSTWAPASGAAAAPGRAFIVKGAPPFRAFGEVERLGQDKQQGLRKLCKRS